LITDQGTMVLGMPLHLQQHSPVGIHISRLAQKQSGFLEQVLPEYLESFFWGEKAIKCQGVRPPVPYVHGGARVFVYPGLKIEDHQNHPGSPQG
jgi:hypothetical protein